MKNILSIVLIFISINLFSQELTTIKVSVPNKTDDVYIVGNQESLGDWNPSKVRMQKISDYEREIKLELTFPVTFKFTRGSWESEGITEHYENNYNNTINQFTHSIQYNIKGWRDVSYSDYYEFPFKLEKLYSQIFDKNRTIAIALPKNYDARKNYSVIYVLDANSLLETVLVNSRLLSNKNINDDGINYFVDNIPEVIIIGIFHNNRGYETKPNLGYNSDIDEDLLLEGSEKLKNYLFNELVPMIDKRYNTSKYNSIVGHSNTGHFVLNLPFQKNNPFQGIISLSVNSESEYFKNKISNYLKNNEETVFYGYGNLDNGYKELAEQIKTEIQSGENKNPNIEVREYDATHNQLPLLAMSSGIKFLFNYYKNLNSFKKLSLQPNFSIEKYVSNYISKNKKYGETLSFTVDDILTLIEISVEKKDKNLFRKIAEYSEKQDDKLEKHLLFYFAKELKDVQTADEYLNRIVKSNNINDYNLVYSNFKNYENYFLNQKQNPEEALDFIEKMINKSDKYKLEFAYGYAKIGITHGIEQKKSKKYLKYCEQNYKENRLFEKGDLKKLKKK